MINEMIDGIPKMVAGLEPWIFLLSIQLGIVIPTDELIFFRGVGQPPTRLTVHYLVGGFKHVLFSIKFGIILSIDFYIFQDG